MTSLPKLKLKNVDVIDNTELHTKHKFFDKKKLHLKLIISSPELKKKNKNISNIIICGMGGSGIAATIVFNCIKNKFDTPYYINKGYKLPEFANKNSSTVTK